MSKRSLQLVATFIAAPATRFEAGVIAAALRAAGVADSRLQWLDAGLALDAFFCAAEADIPELVREIEVALGPCAVDVILQPVGRRRKALLVADMDSTVIAEECLDELAKIVGVGKEVATLTAKAMRGEIEFEDALKTRVALLKGVPVTTIEEIVARLTPNPGARALVGGMRAHGGYTALVSGGFTLFAVPIAARLGFDAAFANTLELEAGRLTGRVVAPVQGASAKREILVRLREAGGLPSHATVAVGDGANDLDMLGEAGLGIAYRAKPIVAAKAHARLNHASLAALLYAQGFAHATRGEESEG
jgi:phosphoserine phosphatase